MASKAVRIRVRYENGVLKPLDKFEASDGEEFEVIVVKKSAKSFKGFTEKSKGLVFVVDEDIVEEFLRERR